MGLPTMDEITTELEAWRGEKPNDPAIKGLENMLALAEALEESKKTIAELQEDLECADRAVELQKKLIFSLREEITPPEEKNDE